ASFFLTVLFTKMGLNANDETGFSLACLKDFESIGTYSVVIGSPGFAGNGKVEVFDGATGNVLEFSDASGIALARLGHAVAPVGDVGGSTLSDFIAGAPGVTNGSAVARVYFGPGSFGYTAALSGSDDYGRSVAGLFSDALNANGHNDVLAGAPHNSNGF